MTGRSQAEIIAQSVVRVRPRKKGLATELDTHCKFNIKMLQPFGDEKIGGRQKIDFSGSSLYAAVLAHTW